MTVSEVSSQLCITHTGRFGSPMQFHYDGGIEGDLCTNTIHTDDPQWKVMVVGVD